MSHGDNSTSGTNNGNSNGSGPGNSGSGGYVTLTGTTGDDILDGGNGKDAIFGSDGNDTLSGGNGNDRLDGGAGNDTLNGGIGHDLLTGGDGADTFVFDSNAFKGGNDTVTDFTPAVTTTTSTTDPTTGLVTTTTTTAVNDVIELHAVLHGYDPATSNIDDFVHFTDDGANSVMSVANVHGHSTHFVTVATLDGITGLDAATMLAAGNLVIS